MAQPKPSTTETSMPTFETLEEWTRSQSHRPAPCTGPASCTMSAQLVARQPDMPKEEVFGFSRTAGARSARTRSLAGCACMTFGTLRPPCRSGGESREHDSRRHDRV